MKTYQYLTAENTVVAVVDEDGISRMSMLASALPPDTEVLPFVAPPPTVPQVVTIRQARLALLAADLLDDIDAAVAASGRAAQIEWEYATEVRRDHPLIAAMQAAKGLSDADVDQLFLTASEM